MGYPSQVADEPWAYGGFFMEKNSFSRADREATVQVSSKETHQAIQRRAEEIYERSGRVPGRDLENWVQAENEIRQETGAEPQKAVVVRVNGVEYVGKYAPGESKGYTPGEFAAGESVAVRFEGQKMYVRRSNGEELETSVVKKRNV